MRSRFMATLSVVLSVIGMTVGPAGTATAGTGLYYQAVDSDNDPYSGIYLRNGTSMSNVDRVYSRYLYYGNTVELICGAWGEAVGPYANRRWHYVYATNGPGGGTAGLDRRPLYEHAQQGERVHARRAGMRVAADL